MVRNIWKVSEELTERQIDDEDYCSILEKMSAIISQIDNAETRRLCNSFLQKSKPILEDWLKDVYPTLCAYTANSTDRKRLLCVYLRRILRGELLGLPSGICHPTIQDAEQMLTTRMSGWDMAYARMQEKAQ